MSRTDHRRLNKHGQCTRCGLTPAHAPSCPPGFWMTKLESSTWHYLSPAERRAYEEAMLSNSEGTKP